MGEKDWILLVTLYEEMNVTRAAKKLYTSQPSLTYRIKHLENNLGIQILHRGNKGISFTSEGEYLVKFSTEMLQKNRELKDHISNMRNTLEGRIRIGASGNYARYELPDVLEAFIKQYPQVEIELITGWSTDILEKLQNESIHVAFIRGDLKWEGEKELLSEEILKVISTEKVSLEDLPNQNFIQYHTDPYLKNTIDKWWRETFNNPIHSTMEVDRIEASIEMVKRGLGYTVVPEVSLKNEDNFYDFPLKIDGKKIYRRTWLVYKKESLELKIVKEFVRQLKSKLQS